MLLLVHAIDMCTSPDRRCERGEGWIPKRLYNYFSYGSTNHVSHFTCKGRWGLKGDFPVGDQKAIDNERTEL
jgi:hypothetical protein